VFSRLIWQWKFYRLNRANLDAIEATVASIKAMYPRCADAILLVASGAISTYDS